MPKHKFAPLKHTIFGTINTTDGTHPSAFRELIIDVDRDVKINAKGYPACKADRLGAQLQVHAREDLPLQHKKVGYFEARCPDGVFKVRGERALFKTGTEPGHEYLHEWAHGLAEGEELCLALEDCRHVYGRLERFLLGRGELALRVGTRLMAGTRRSARTYGKSDSAPRDECAATASDAGSGPPSGAGLPRQEARRRQVHQGGVPLPQTPPGPGRLEGAAEPEAVLSP